jgi:hypothetical protein
MYKFPIRRNGDSPLILEKKSVNAIAASEKGLTYCTVLTSLMQCITIFVPIYLHLSILV